MARVQFIEKNVGFVEVWHDCESIIHVPFIEGGDLKNLLFVSQNAREQSNFYVSARISTLLPTFAKVDKTKLRKWKKSSEDFQKQVVNEELKSKQAQLKIIREELRNIHDEIRLNCSTIRRVAIIRTLSALQKNQYQSLMKVHAKKLTRLIDKKVDIDKHINNLSSYHLSFLERLVLCRGLQFAIPQPTSPRVIQASFEKAYWKLEPLLLSDSKKDLACPTLRSIALNYIANRDPKPPKALLQAINNLKRREGIIITKPDKGSGVVVMDKTDYLRLLCDTSIRDSTKFIE